MLNYLVTKLDDGSGGFYYELKPFGYLCIIVIAILLVLSIAFIKNRSTENKETKIFSTKQLAFSSLLLALATVLSMIKLPLKLPMGGSMTLLSMFFICYIGYLYGLRIGLIASVTYGVLQLIIEPYIIGIPQLLIDYIIAFGALGISGAFSSAKHGLIKGYLLGTFLRFVASYISGLIFFAQYAADWNTIPVIYSAVYNGSYIYAEVILTLIIICLPPVKTALAQVKKTAIS